MAADVVRPFGVQPTTVVRVLILLDLDGTLNDPYDGVTRSVAYAVARVGLPGLEERELLSFIGPPLQDQFAALGLDDDGVLRAVSAYRECFSDQGLYENRGLRRRRADAPRAHRGVAASS